MFRHRREPSATKQKKQGNCSARRLGDARGGCYCRDDGFGEDYTVFDLQGPPIAAKQKKR